MKEMLRPDVAREQVAVLEDMLERCDLEGIIVVAGSSPADVPLQIRLTQVGQIENLLLKILQERPVRFLTAYLERSAEVFEEMNMAELGDDTGIYLLRRHADGCIVVADERLQIVACVFELREVPEHCLEVFRRCKDANGNVMREVVDAVDERNLLIVTFHLHIFPVHDEEAAEAFGIAVREGDLIVMGKHIQFLHNSPIRRINAFSDPRSERTDACAFEMK